MSARSIGNIHPMHRNDASRLKHLLERLAREKTPGRAQCRQPVQGHPELMAAVLREIDETVLPRQITLRSDANAVAHLLVSNRRLMGLTSPGQDATGNSPPAQDPEAAAAWYVAQLNRLFADCRKGSCQVTARINAAMGSRISCSPQMLAQAAGLEWGGPASDPAPDTRVEDLQQLALAWLQRQSTTETGRAGQDALIDLLQKTDAARAGSGSRASKFRGGRTAFSLLRISASLAIAVLEDRDKTLLAVIPADKADQAIDLVGK